MLEVTKVSLRGGVTVGDNAYLPPILHFCTVLDDNVSVTTGQFEDLRVRRHDLVAFGVLAQEVLRLVEELLVREVFRGGAGVQCSAFCGFV